MKETDIELVMRTLESSKVLAKKRVRWKSCPRKADLVQIFRGVFYNIDGSVDKEIIDNIKKVFVDMLPSTQETPQCITPNPELLHRHTPSTPDNHSKNSADPSFSKYCLLSSSTTTNIHSKSHKELSSFTAPTHQMEPQNLKPTPSTHATLPTKMPGTASELNLNTKSVNPIDRSHQETTMPMEPSRSSHPMTSAKGLANDEWYDDTTQKMLLSNIKAMGFTDTQEIQSSIQKLRHKHNKCPTAEEVMVDIISMREETEEARKMDQARLASEQMRKEETRRRQEAIKARFDEKLRASSLDEWMTDDAMFPHSWVLKSRAMQPLQCFCGNNFPLKNKLLDLLKLEKNARKWYKDVLPIGYFAHLLPEKLCHANTPVELQHLLDQEITALMKAMYELSEQKGGVPVLLLNAQEKAITRGLIRSSAKFVGKRKLDDGTGEADVIEILE